ncbi:hypothetical protein QW180_15350 [Vibrio sinaloensis]|nr:hypothetical protein [Vibrio sinaloensis]
MVKFSARLCQKALTFVARIDAESAIDEQEWIHAQEMRLLLEVALAKKKRRAR